MFSFEGYPSIFNLFAFLFNSGTLLLSLMIQVKVISHRKYFLLSFLLLRSFTLTERHLIVAMSGRESRMRNRIWKGVIFGFTMSYPHTPMMPQQGLLIGLRTLVTGIVKLLWNCCASPAPLLHWLPTTSPLSTYPSLISLYPESARERDHRRAHSIFTYAVRTSPYPWLAFMTADLENPGFIFIPGLPLLLSSGPSLH